MKIAVICPYILTRSIQKALGIQAADYTRATGTISLSQGLSNIPGVEVHQVSTTHLIKGRAIIEDGNVFVHFIGIPPKTTSLSFLQYPKHLVHDELDRIRPDIVHGHHCETGSAYYAVSSKYKNIVGIHNYIPLIRKMSGQPTLSTMAIFRYYEKQTLSRAAHITVDSHYIEEMIRPLTSAKIHRIANCVQYKFFSKSKENYEIKEGGRPSIVFVGQIRKEKGLQVLLDAFALIKESVPDLLLKIIGNMDSAYGHEISERIWESSFVEDIEILGWLEWDQIIKEMLTTELVVIPSLFEPFGCTAIEAMALGLPVLGSRTGGIKENIIDGVTGALFNPGDTGDLAEKSISLLSDKGLRERIGVNAKKVARREFHPDIIAEKHMRLYQTL